VAKRSLLGIVKRKSEVAGNTAAIPSVYRTYRRLRLTASSPSGGCCSRRGVHLRGRRQGIADRLGAELGEDRLEGRQSRREGVAVNVDRTFQVLDECVGFFV
jgi:hypothetical protein